MRVYSPSAESQGPGPGQEVLQTGKREVDLHVLEPVGNYAVHPAFSDGYNSGTISWDYPYFLGSRQEALWGDNSPAVCCPTVLTAMPPCRWRPATAAQPSTLRSSGARDERPR